MNDFTECIYFCRSSSINLKSDRANDSISTMKCLQQVLARNLAIDGRVAKLLVGGQLQIGRIHEVLIDEGNSGVFSLSQDQHGLAVGPVISSARKNTNIKSFWAKLKSKNSYNFRLLKLRKILNHFLPCLNTRGKHLTLNQGTLKGEVSLYC